MDPAQSSNSFFSSFNFQRIVILIAIIMLIVSMVFIGHALYKQSTDVTWPPKIPKCPDYWTLGPKSDTDPTQECKNLLNVKCEYNGIPSNEKCSVPK